VYQVNLIFFSSLELKKNQVRTWKKQGAKNGVVVIQKEKKQPGLVSF
jgi:hypothetical protein